MSDELEQALRELCHAAGSIPHDSHIKDAARRIREALAAPTLPSSEGPAVTPARCKICNDEGVVHTHEGAILGPCDCTKSGSEGAPDALLREADEAELIEAVDRAAQDYCWERELGPAAVEKKRLDDAKAALAADIGKWKWKHANTISEVEIKTERIAELNEQLSEARAQVATLTKELRQAEQKRDEYFRAHHATFSALDAVRLLVNMDDLDDYGEVPRRVEAALQDAESHALRSLREKIEAMLRETEQQISSTDLRWHRRELNACANTLGAVLSLCAEAIQERDV